MRGKEKWSKAEWFFINSKKGRKRGEAGKRD
jgi:hypothetical protein